jgi:hypothetical protein
MNTFNFTDGQVEVLRLALIHELNENSYFKGLCKTEEQRRRVDLARAAIEDVYCIISNRRPERVRVDKVENNAGDSENE